MYSLELLKALYNPRDFTYLLNKVCVSVLLCVKVCEADHGLMQC